MVPAVEGSIPFVHPNFFLNDEKQNMISQKDVSFWLLFFVVKLAKVAELVDALDLGSSGASRESSSLSFRTTLSDVTPANH